MRYFILFFLLIPQYVKSSLPEELQERFNSVAKSAYPAVVNIRVEQEKEARIVEPEFFFGYVVPDEKIYKYKVRGAGSGVIVSKDGYVVTNYHVVEESDEIKVKIKTHMGETTYPAYYVGGDAAMDLAVIKIKSGESFSFLPFSSSAPKTGDIVFAAGYPFGYSQTLTQGIVSGLDASLKVEGRSYRSLIQTDAAINQGNSGGPLINLKGEIIGINTAIMSPTGVFAGIGFAIPANQVKEVFEEIVYGKKVERAWLGVSLLPVKQLLSAGYDIYIPEGGIINKIIKDSPAEKAGLKRGDVIISMDGQEIKDDEDLFAAVYRKKPGEKTFIEYVRDGKKKNVSAVLGLRPQNISSAKISSADTADKTQNAATAGWEGVSFSFSQNGARINDINPKSPLKKYLKEGDLIKGINNIKINSEKDFKEAVSKSSLAQGILFDIERDGEPYYLSVQIK